MLVTKLNSKKQVKKNRDELKLLFARVFRINFHKRLPLAEEEHYKVNIYIKVLRINRNK